MIRVLYYCDPNTGVGLLKHEIAAHRMTNWRIIPPMKRVSQVLFLFSQPAVGGVVATGLSLVLLFGLLFFTRGVSAQSFEVDSTINTPNTPLPASGTSKPTAARQPGKQNPYLIQQGNANPSSETESGRKPFQLKAVQNYQLPPEMYGQWAVTATLLETNMPGSYPTVVNDIWQFEQAGDVVSLSNPNTGAYATIHVDRVQNNWATFHHRVVIKEHRKYLLEQPSIQVNGDRMLGKTSHTYIYMRNGNVEKTYRAVFRIDATRLGESRVMFDDQPKLHDTDFEVADIQREFEGSTPETTDSSLYRQ